MSRHLQSWFEEFGDTLLHPCAALLIRVNLMPDVVMVAPDVICQSDGHRRGAPTTALLEAAVRDQKVVQIHQQPYAASVSLNRARQTASAPSTQPSHRGVPSFLEGRLDGLAQAAAGQFFEKATWTAKDDPRADLNHATGRIANLDHLTIEQVGRSHQPRQGMATARALASGTPDLSQHLQQRLLVDLPAVDQKQRRAPPLGPQAWPPTQVPAGPPLQKEALHRQGRQQPLPTMTPDLRPHLVQLHPLDLHLLNHLLMVLLSALRRQALEPMHSLYVHITNIGRPFVTHAPALTFEQPGHGLFRQFGLLHQRPLSLGKLGFTDVADQSFNVFVLARPRPMPDIALTWLLEYRTLWIRTAKKVIFVGVWSKQVHQFGPPSKKLDRILPDLLQFFILSPHVIFLLDYLLSEYLTFKLVRATPAGNCFQVSRRKVLKFVATAPLLYGFSKFTLPDPLQSLPQDALSVHIAQVQPDWTTRAWRCKECVLSSPKFGQGSTGTAKVVNEVTIVDTTLFGSDENDSHAKLQILRRERPRCQPRPHFLSQRTATAENQFYHKPRLDIRVKIIVC